MGDERTDALAIAVLWLALVVGMVLHFNYELSGLRYGVDLALPNANGTVPWSNFVIKALFYVVPFLLAVAVTSFAGGAYRATNFGLSLLFLLANAFHLVATAMREGRDRVRTDPAARRGVARERAAESRFVSLVEAGQALSKPAWPFRASFPLSRAALCWPHSGKPCVRPARAQVHAGRVLGGAGEAECFVG